jgi:hypothetical protein
MGKWVRAMALIAGAFGVFWYHPAAADAAVCPNEHARTGLSGQLPNCRAYELVTPADSNGRIITALNTYGRPSRQIPMELASPTGDSVAFLTYHAPLPDPRGASGVTDVYEAARQAGGWETSRLLSLPGSALRIPVPAGMSPDHLYAFSRTNDGLSPLSINRKSTLYLVGPDGSFELVGLGSLSESEPYAEGRFLGEGGRHIVFSTGHGVLQSFLCFSNPDCEVHQLEPDAAPTGTGTIYDREADGETHVVSMLPGEVPQKTGEDAFYRGTSRDGSATAFEVGGTLYVRLDNQETKQVAPGSPIFAGVSEDGDYVFYVVPTGTEEAGVVHRFDTATGADVLVNPGDEGLIVNVSGDGSHVYFISDAQLDGAEGIAGQPNLYVWDGGSPKYIRTVLPSDLVQTSESGNGFPALANWTRSVVNQPDDGEKGPGTDSSRTTPDGSILVFESRAQLTAYDNAGHTEIYRYDDGDGSLICVSCNPHAIQAAKDAQLEDLFRLPRSVIVHNVSEDGSRVFFETAEALASRDVDGVNDVYQWQEGATGENPSLISSGQSREYPSSPKFDGRPAPNTLFSVTPTGDDVFFTSQDPLVPGAPEGGSSAIYDARVGGGFPWPVEIEPCLEDDCRPPELDSTPSSITPPPSEALRSSGNVKPRKRHCRRSKHKARRRCVKGTHKRHATARGSTKSNVQGAAPSEDADQHAGLSAPFTVAEAFEPQVATQATPGPSPRAVAGAWPPPFGIEEVSASLSNRIAAMRPDFTSKIVLDHTFTEEGKVDEETSRTEEVTVSIPPGLIGNINAVPRCKTGELVAVDCPTDSQVGIAQVLVTTISGELTEPVYNLEPPHPSEEVARLGFVAGQFPAFIDIKVRTASDYGVTATVYGTSGLVSLVSAKTTLWGNPASSVHDKERLTPLEANECKFVCGGGSRPSTIAPEDRKAFMTNPSACQSGQVDFAVRSYQLPGQVFTASAPLPQITDCTGLPFAPTFTAEPTDHTAGAPTGLHTTLTLPQHLGEEERATATMREARVTLPAGMQVAAGAANWIGTCSEEQVGYREEADTACPDASKLGTATISSPALPESIEGTIYQRAPAPGRQFGLWLTADALGLHIKIPGELEPDKATGRLTAVFRDLPQVPVGQIDLDVWGGPRAPLQNPDRCGTYTTDYTFAPHSSDPAVSGTDQMQITEGCDQPFSPTLHAGVTKPVAGAFSPFVFDLNREDGQQALRGFELHLPDGELAKIKGVPLCPDADAAAATCPAASRIGSLKATTGPGPDPLVVPQPGKPEPQIYLAGPYQGAPFSILSQVPAQAGPFDLGTLAVRSALQVDPETGRATVKADPLPQFFEGVGIAYRHLHAVVDRPEFSLNPTDCREAAVTSDVTSTKGAVAHPQARFQIDGCKRLKFKPRLSLRLKGGTRRADYPALTAVLKARKGDANIAFTSVALPHSEFLAQEHIGTICTRKQFAVDKCPKGSVYGKAKAWTPLLDKPLSGPVHLRSSDNPLPDMVVKLGGRLEIFLVGRIDSVNGGIRTTFKTVPDAPVSKFVLKMKGGKKGLLTNSTDICRGAHRATAVMRAQNGRASNLRPRLLAGGCGKKQKGGKKK